MQTTAIRTVANSLPENEVILLTLLISKKYIPYTDLAKKFGLFYSFVYFHQVFYELLKIIWYDERRIDA